MEQPVSPATPATQNCVLVVEDHPPNVMVATYYLEELGYCFDVAVNGTEALKKIDSGVYAFILTDIQLPDIDGLEIAKHIRRREKELGLPPVRIIATTGRATDDDRILCKRAGIDDYLSKPFRLEDLIAKLKLLELMPAA